MSLNFVRFHEKLFLAFTENFSCPSHEELKKPKKKMKIGSFLKTNQYFVETTKNTSDKF